MAHTFIIVVMCMVSLICGDTPKSLRLGECIFPNIKNQSQSQNTALSTLERLNPLLNKSFTTRTSNYIYTFVVCGHVPNKDDSTTGLVQDRLKVNATKVIGRITNADIKGGRNWLMLEYGNGSLYGSHCKKTLRRALIMITCKWGEKKGTFRFVEEVNDREEGCFYLFDLVHESACTPEPKKISTGSILLIVFACVVSVYLVIGIIYQRITSGAKGIDQIPNLGFWLNFGSLTADGCDLVCRCKSQAGSNVYRQVDTAGGIGPDAMGSAEDADEHLLPM